MTRKKNQRSRKPRAMTKRIAVAFASRSIDILRAGDEPPTEFRLFKSGWNEAEGDVPAVLFDDLAARSVMAAYEAHGVDKMVDLEHLSTDPNAPNFDPDARAWCELELRDGELWAVDVKWTDDGAERLTSKRQRYISPYFVFDKDLRIVKIRNIALTALPATHGTPELVAARLQHTAPTEPAARAAYRGDTMMDPALIMKAINAVKGKNGKEALALLEELIAAAVGVEAPAEAPAEDMPPAADVAEVIAEAVPSEAAASVPATPVAPAPMAEATAAAARLMALTGRKSISASLETVEEYRASHLKAAALAVKTKAETKALESSERCKLAKLSVKHGMNPAIAWKDTLVDSPEPAEWIAAMSIEAVRAESKRLERMPAAPAAPVPPAAGMGAETFKIRGKTVELSAGEVAHCERHKVDRERFADHKLSLGLTAPREMKETD